jgi:hypothetical protein
MERLLEYDASHRGLRDPLPEDEWEGCEPITGGEAGVYDKRRMVYVARPIDFTTWFKSLPF